MFGQLDYPYGNIKSEKLNCLCLKKSICELFQLIALVPNLQTAKINFHSSGIMSGSTADFSVN